MKPIQLRFAWYISILG